MNPNLSQSKSEKKSISKKNKKNVEKGREFEDQVASLYLLMGYTVERNIEICHKKVDILASFHLPLTQRKHRVIVECKDEKKNSSMNQRVMEFKGLLGLAREVGQADSAEIITRKSWSDQAKGFASEVGIGLYTFEEKLSKIIDFSNYIERIIYDYENFAEFVEKGRVLRNPIIEIMNRSDLYNTYVPLSCRMLENEKIVEHKSLDEYVEKWLGDPDHNHLSILGDFGTGKSSFCLYLTYKLAKEYRKDPINARIPLFISLRDYTKAVNLQQLITDLLLNKYNIRIENYAVFQRFLDSGRLILLFDGFDEMATKTDRSLTIRNFEELTRVVVAGSKTILTCRTHYFTDQKQVDDILRGDEGSELLRIIRRQTNFQIVQIEEFTDEQIQQLIGHYHPNDINDAWIAIRRNLHDLARRPLLLDMIIKTLPKLLAMDKTVNTVHLYNEYTCIWIEREDYHAKMAPHGKKAFMEDLAMKMWFSETQSIHYLDLREQIQNYFPHIQTLDQLDYFDHDTRTCSFLSRDAMGNYYFIHKSFMEFFVANRIYNNLITNSIDIRFCEKEFSPEISSFVAQFVSENTGALDNLCHWAFDNTKTLSWNAISVLPFLKAFQPDKAVEYLLQLCKKEKLKSGVIWVIGELGISHEDVLRFLQNLVCDPSKPESWWEAAFALQKLGAVSNPVDKLIENLPLERTFNAAIGNLAKVVDAHEESCALVNQQDVVAIVKEHRGGRSKSKIEEELKTVLNSLKLSSDTIGRRSYYAVWLFGELRMRTVLPMLISAVDHPQSAVRNMLAESIGKIGEVAGTNQSNCIGDDELIALRILLYDHYYRTRLHAAEAIGKVHAISLLPDLKDALEREPLRDVQNELIKTIRLLESYHSAN